MDRPASSTGGRGATLIRHLADDPAFRGIGYATASKLWAAFGERLYAILGDGDAVAMTEILGEERAYQLVAAWREKLAEGDVVVWLDENGFDARLAKKVVTLWGDQAAAKLRKQPYTMMALADWPAVDAAGRRLGILPDDPVRLVAAVEAVLYERLDEHHTWTDGSTLTGGVAKLLNCSRKTAQEAIEIAVAHRAAFAVGHGFQPAGAHMMERYVVDRIRQMLEEPAMGDLIAREVSDAELHAWLDAGAGGSGVRLDEEQRLAVQIAVQARCGIVRGGAGVGKTTVLRTIARACAAFGRTTHMMAVAGRAAVRISEATGWPASTIAAFLKGVEARKIPLGPESLIVIDEASMVDLPTIYRILRCLPDGCRLLVVGDPGQLPPIGFGLVLHALVGQPDIPTIELTKVYRQTETTGIPAVAKAVREGRMPAFLDHVDRVAVGVTLVGTDNSDAEKIVDVVADLGGFSEDLRIVCAVKAGPVGTEALNRRFHDIFGVGKLRHPTLQFAEGEPVMFLRNDYQRGLRNGSLGRIVKIDGETIHADFDGEIQELAGAALHDLALAYAVTVHKAQGSSFRRVVMPIQRTRLLDRSLAYTAITRATDFAVLVGSAEVLKEALGRDAHADRRSTALGALFVSG